MRSLEPAPRGDANLGAVVTDLRRQIDTLSRRISRQPRPVDSGSAVGVTRAVGAYRYPGAGRLFFDSWAITSNPYEDTAPSPSVTVDSADGLVIGDKGWYSFRWKQTLLFDVSGSEPTSCQVELNSDRYTDQRDFVWTEPIVANHYTVTSDKVACAIDKTLGPIWCEVGEVWTPAVGWVGTGTPGGYGLHLFVARVG